MKQYIFDYISEVLLEFFSTALILPGERYHIRYEQQEQVSRQYEEMRSIATMLGYTIAPFTFNDYISYAIVFPNYRLIIAASGPDVTVDFLTGLRNRVAENSQLAFDRSSILFIHNTSLDSIIGGCKSLAESGMPLNVRYIRESIQSRIAADDHFKSYQKVILNFRLNQVGEGNDDTYSLFNYAIYLQILGRKAIGPDDYVKLGLFPDQGLEGIDEIEVEKRLRKNDEWFKDINSGHQYGGLIQILEKTFSQKGVDKLLKDNWADTELKVLIDAETEKNETANIAYKPNVREKTDDLQVVWDKAEDTTLAKSRIRHIIVFNYDHREKVNLNLEFDRSPKKDGLGNRFNLQETEVLISGRKIVLTCILNEPSTLTYKALSYEHPGFSSRYQFHILIVPFREVLINAIKSLYLIRVSKAKTWHLEVDLESRIVLNDGQVSRLTDVITPGAVFPLKDDQTLELKTQIVDQDFEKNEIAFSLNYLEQLIPVHIPVEISKPQFISGADLRARKFEQQKSFYYQSADPYSDKTVITLTQGTEKFYVVDEFRESLRFEQYMITSGHPAFFQDGKQLAKHDEIRLPEPLLQAYEQMVSCYRRKELLPSLAVLDIDLKVVLENYVETYMDILQGLNTGVPLGPLEMDLLKIGSIEMRDGTKLLKFSPLHPLNVAYQLHLHGVVQGQQMVSYLLDKLRSINLVPYIKGRRRYRSDAHYIYQPIEQGHSPEWLHYFCDEVSSQQVSRHFVDTLVEQKIEQFYKHFKYLFTHKDAVLKINLFNQGDTKQILQGILLYYARFFRKESLNPDDAVAIQVTIYGSENYMTKFEELSVCDNVALIESAFGVRFPTQLDRDELLELYSRKVTFFKVDKAVDYTYAHLSFYQFSPSEVVKSSNQIMEVASGISLSGLLADVPSVDQVNAYRTGFGMKGVDPGENNLLKMTKDLNTVARVTHTDDQYNTEEGIAFVISRDATTTIKKVYAKSQWVTFIEPKVDLSFFEVFDDVVIIHYSDQYNNASGYDAITITSKWKPYEAVILEVFKEQYVQANGESVLHIIDLFNALNGQWLLGLNNPYKNNHLFRLEKLSLLSAVKAALVLLDHPAITWVPVSLEEILRVSGAVGLKKADGLFSVKNLGGSGVHSDDLLMIGLEEKDSGLQLYFYPFEVKIGLVEAGTLVKAREQSFRTAGLIRKFLMENSLSGKIYRNFFAKLLLVNADKCQLYNIWPVYREKWQAVEGHRARLLGDDFSVSTDLDHSIGYFGVLGFKWTTEFFARSLSYENDGCTFMLLKSDGLDYLAQDLQALSEHYGNDEIEGISSAKLLRNRYPLTDQEIIVPEEDEIVINDNTSETELLADPVFSGSPELSIDSAAELQFNRLSAYDIQRISQAIHEKLTAIGIEVIKELPADINFIEGPAFYRIEIKPEKTTTIKKIKGAVEELNIALHLPEEASVRIFSGLGKIWLEAPKADEQKVKVTTGNIWPLFDKNEEFRVPFGTDIEGRVQSVNFSSSNSPHVLLAGTTGSGKSVVLDTLIRGAIHFYSPKELQLFLIDPKGNELIEFEGTPHVPESNGMTSEDAIELLKAGVEEMDKRYVLFRDIHKATGKAAKDLIEYNKVLASTSGALLPRWLIILDEYSDLLDENAANKSIIETLLKRLAQKARAAGIHVIIATQKPLATIVSSAIKSNLPGVIALRVRSANDSRVILDDNGAETLAGKGDSLFKNGTGQMIRVQAAIHER